MLRDLVEATRDLVFGFLPDPFCPKEWGEYAFLCHPLDASDAARKYAFAQNINESLFNLWVKHFWPVLGAEIAGPAQKDGKLLKGWAVIQPLPPALMVRDPEFGRKRIIRGVKFCEKLGFRLVALGGYNSIITHDGEDLIGKVNACVTTGNTYSALLILQNLEKIAQTLRLDLSDKKIAIIGAAGSVGSACAKILPKLVGEVWLMDLNIKALKELHGQLSDSFTNIKLFGDLNMITQLDIIITVTSTPRAIITNEKIRSGMIFIDAAQPKNISESIAKNRTDVIVIDSGIAQVPSVKCKMNMGPGENEVYACLGEAMILCLHNRISNYSIGKVQVERVYELSELAKDAGFRVADFRNAGGYITKDYLNLFKERYCHH